MFWFFLYHVYVHIIMCLLCLFYSPLTHNLTGLFVVEFFIPVQNPQKGKWGQKHQADTQEHVACKRSKIHSLGKREKNGRKYLSAVNFLASHKPDIERLLNWYRKMPFWLAFTLTDQTQTRISHLPSTTCFKLKFWITYYKRDTFSISFPIHRLYQAESQSDCRLQYPESSSQKSVQNRTS